MRKGLRVLPADLRGVLGLMTEKRAKITPPWSAFSSRMLMLKQIGVNFLNNIIR